MAKFVVVLKPPLVVTITTFGVIFEPTFNILLKTIFKFIWFEGSGPRFYMNYLVLGPEAQIACKFICFCRSQDEIPFEFIWSLGPRAHIPYKFPGFGGPEPRFHIKSYGF